MSACRVAIPDFETGFRRDCRAFAAGAAAAWSASVRASSIWLTVGFIASLPPMPFLLDGLATAGGDDQILVDTRS